MYIIFKDGFANSDRRFPTKLKSEENQYIHDELSFWVDKDGNKKESILEMRWMNYNDKNTDGSKWINEKGIMQKLRKGGFVDMSKINKENCYNLLPEYHLRPIRPKIHYCKRI